MKKTAFKIIHACLLLGVLTIRTNSAGFQDSALHSDTNTSTWKYFASRSGWSVKVPPSWKVWSCEDCPDPGAPGVFVSFGHPSAMEGMVTIEELSAKPADQSVTQWLDHLKTSANLNPVVSTEAILLSGLPALKVKYGKLSSEIEFESIYVVNGTTTLMLSFFNQERNVPIEADRNYAAYLQMVRTFNFAKR